MIASLRAGAVEDNSADTTNAPYNVRSGVASASPGETVTFVNFSHVMITLSCICATFVAGCNDSERTERVPKSRGDARLTIRQDISREYKRHREILGGCHQIVADTYRRLGKGNTRLSFKMSLLIEASSGNGSILIRSLEAPSDVPASARQCIVEHFPRHFASTNDFSGTLEYETCLFVLPSSGVRASAG